MSVATIACPADWPTLPGTSDPFEWSAPSACVSWVTKNRLFFFRVQTCLGGMPVLPHLLICKSSDGGRRAERFRVSKYHFAGRYFIQARGGVIDSNPNSVFVAVDLIRVEKAEFNLLREEGPVIARGRRPNPILRISNFAVTVEDKSILTHWLQNPLGVDGHPVPYAGRARELLPEDLFNLCSQLPVTSDLHPFANDFQMNLRLLPREEPEFAFIDLFAGIGGFRLAMQQEGGQCTFASEIDNNARDTYEKNFGIVPFGDITAQATKALIPGGFDILCGGFPCQAFSMAGKREGFDDELQRGTLYRQIVEIAQEHQPKAIFCENVKGLLSSAEGQALQMITQVGGSPIFEA